jgi:hypothetical protein
LGVVAVCLELIGHLLGEHIAGYNQPLDGILNRVFREVAISDVVDDEHIQSLEDAVQADDSLLKVASVQAIARERHGQSVDT